MTESKRTPGKWKTEGFCIKYGDGFDSVIADCSDLKGNALDNARYICMAVNNHEELVEALQDLKGSMEIVLDYVSEFNLKNSHRWDAYFAVNKAKAILSKLGTV